MALPPLPLELGRMFSAGGAMDALMRDVDWAATPIGAPVHDVALGERLRDDLLDHRHHDRSVPGGVLKVTRKGAIRAGAADLGLIPGSMGTRSFVVRCLGNETGYCSASTERVEG